MYLQGKVALVTGCANLQGIGAATARALAAAGARVAITDRTWDPDDGVGQVETPHLVKELSAYGATVLPLLADLSDPDAPGHLMRAVEAALGPVDILVNNAAVSRLDGLAGFSAQTLDEHYAVNVRGTTLLCVEFARRVAARSPRTPGRIINLTSGQGTGPMPQELAYAASKGAIEAFTVSFSAAVAALGITVNAVDPGPTDTGWIWPDLRRELEAAAPLGRIGLPQDAARLICFLASDQGAWITGQIIRSRGGF